MSTVLERLDRLELELRRISRDLADLRAEALASQAPDAPPEPLGPPTPTPLSLPPLKVPPEPAAARGPAPWSPEVLLPKLEAAGLLGARGLALAGGIVTLLGIVFFFALAASNGWIGPAARVLLGAAASTVVFVGGVLLRARYGRVDAAVAAAGAGTAGGYATLLFAAARYELVPPLGALALATGIAAMAVALSLVWSSEIVAGFGLIGAMSVPAVALLDDDATAIGTAFVALVLLGAAVVGVRQRWSGILVAAGAVSLPQLAVLLVQEGEPARARTVAVAAAFGLLYLGTGVARQLHADGLRLDALAGAYAGGNVAVTLLTGFVLLDGDGRGVWLAVAAAGYAAVAVILWSREPELASLSAAGASVLAAASLGQLLDGPSLVVAWAAETAALAWLGRRLADTRFQLLALGYLGVALTYALSVEAEPDLLLERSGDHLAAVPALLAVAAGALAYGWVARSWPPSRGLDTMPTFLRELVEDLQLQRDGLSKISLGLAGALALDAASLSVLELFDRLHVEPAFDWGHVAVSGLWSVTALGLLWIGLARRVQHLEIGGLVLLGATIVLFAGFTLPELEHVRGWSAVVVAVACAAAALIHGLLGRLPVVAVGAVALDVALSAFASYELLPAGREGYGLLAAAAAHAVVAAAVWRRRQLASCFWVGGVALGLGAASLLLEGTWFVLAVTLAAGCGALLGRRLAEPRLWLSAAVLAGLAGVYTLAELAAPDDFFRASHVPADGVPALLLVAAALGALFLALPRLQPLDALDRWIDGSVEPLRRTLLALLAGFCLYAASLSILGGAELLSSAGERTEFQRGQTAVSAFWGIVAFSALLVGLRRGARELKLTGLGLFALALGKLFLYDLSTLSSITRALSFLAVGAVLLLAGFFYQRLAEPPPEAT